ncbi:MAG: hypothetical protein R3A80_12290 [Bdellovibrionota bacterium]
MAQSTLFNSTSIEGLNDKLSGREFYGVRGATYDASVWSGVAALETRAYPWSMNWWKKIKLSWPVQSEAPYYQEKLSAYYYEVPGDKLLVIFGTSFGTVGRGTWYRKFLSKIRSLHPNTSVLIFPGYLSSEALKSKPVFPDPGVRFVAYDVLRRIESFLSQKRTEGKVFNKIGSIGLSGGASIQLRMLQLNTQLKSKVGHWNSALFNWGNIAFSPVLSAVAAAEVVDAHADYLEEQRRVRPEFDIHDWFKKQVLRSVLPWNHALNANYILNMSQDPELDSYREVQGLVTYSVIHELAKFSKKQSPDYRGAMRFKAYYEGYAYPLLQKIFKGRLGMGYEEFSSFTDSARETQNPLRVVYAEDDPILSVKTLLNPEGRGHSKVMSVLRAYQSRAGVRVDLNRFGGHLGYLLDNEYVDRLFYETYK